MQFVHRVVLLAEIQMDLPIETEHPSEEELQRATSEQLQRFAGERQGTSTCIYVRRYSPRPRESAGMGRQRHGRR